VTGGSTISENQKFYNRNFGISEIMVIPGRSQGSSPESMAPPERWDEWILRCAIAHRSSMLRIAPE
jgi:hypothetical protein